MSRVGVYGLEAADTAELIVLYLEDGSGLVGRSLAIAADVVVVCGAMAMEGKM
jgi:hypothetical protein